MVITMRTNQDIAEKALLHARKYILAGSTHPDNNDCDLNMRRQLYSAVQAIRSECVRDINIISADKGREALKLFKKSIELCKKFSIGNCFEFSLMALEYVLHSSPDTYAEVYKIKGGDHIFLVIGRSRDSDPADPSTWGADAIICDPWSNKIYAASRYLSELKAYFFKQVADDRQLFDNFIEDFNSTHHRLAPHPYMNTDYIKQHMPSEDIQAILARYKEKNERFLKGLCQLMTELDKISARLVLLYGKDDQKYVIIQQKLNLARGLVESLRHTIEQEDASTAIYGEVEQHLEQALRCKLKFFSTSLQLSAEEKSTLNRHRNTCWGFFFAPKTARDAHQSIHKANQIMNGLCKDAPFRG